MGVFYIPSEILSLCYFRRGDPSHEYMKQTNTLYIGCISLGIRKKTLTQLRKDLKEIKHKKNIKNTKSIRILTGLDAPKLPFLKQHGIQFYISLFSSFLSFSNAFPSDLQSIKDAIPFRPQASSPLSSQTTTVGSTRAQSSSSTQQPGDRRTALLSLRLT